MLGLALGLQYTRKLIGGGGGGVDADYQAVLTYATAQGYTLPSEPQQVLQNNLVVALKSAGVWGKLDSFNLFAVDGDSDFALIDWKRLITLTAFNSVDFVVNLGVTGLGSSSYIKTSFIPSINGVNYLQNSASFGFFSNTNNIGGGLTMGSRDSGVLNRSFDSIAYNATDSSYDINQGAPTALNGSNIESNGFFQINRSGSVNTQLFKNGTQIGTGTRPSTGLSSVEFYLLAANNNGSVFVASNRQIALTFMGGDLSAEAAGFNLAVNNYLTAI